MINKPENVKAASNKKTFFEMAEGKVSIPKFTTSVATASEWINEGRAVVCREKLSGHSADGLVMLNNRDEFDGYNHSKARLYVQYVPKKEEYRIHVMGGKVILTQRKARKNDVPDEFVNWQVRNVANGFIFAKNEGHTPPNKVLEQAILACEVAGLDFGAVDVIWNAYKEKAVVLEINTAPGLDGTTVDTYIEGLKELVHIYNGLVEEDVEKAKGKHGLKRKKYTKMYTLDDLAQAQPAHALNMEEIFEPAPAVGGNAEF